MKNFVIGVIAGIVFILSNTGVVVVVKDDETLSVRYAGKTYILYEAEIKKRAAPDGRANPGAPLLMTWERFATATGKVKKRGIMIKHHPGFHRRRFESHLFSL